MKILLSVDAHGEIIQTNEKVDLILVAGDFAKGDKLRKMIFNGGSPEEAKEELISSSNLFFDNLLKFQCPIIATIGNAEELAREGIISLMKEKGIVHNNLDLIEINNFKILGIDFFVEEWWADKYKPNNENTKKRAEDDEKKINHALKKIKEVDILLSHLPPYEILDFNPDPPEFIKSYNGHMGSKILKEYIQKIKPKLVVCGHIHIPGEIMLGRTRVINPGSYKVIEI
jgi:Icc-related predicted phosphoesterase